jgi:hypothetical protein
MKTCGKQKQKHPTMLSSVDGALTPSTTTTTEPHSNDDFQSLVNNMRTCVQSFESCLEANHSARIRFQQTSEKLVSDLNAAEEKAVKRVRAQFSSVREKLHEVSTKTLAEIAINVHTSAEAVTTARALEEKGIKLQNHSAEGETLVELKKCLKDMLMMKTCSSRIPEFLVYLDFDWSAATTHFERELENAAVLVTEVPPHILPT